MKGKFFWIAIALGSIGASYVGYQRFKKIRPDLFEQPATSTMDESERAERIAEYQQKGDALTRAAMPRRNPAVGESCVDGFLVEASETNSAAEAKRIIENGKPVACDSVSQPPPNP